MELDDVLELDFLLVKSTSDLTECLTFSENFLRLLESSRERPFEAERSDDPHLGLIRANCLARSCDGPREGKALLDKHKH